MGPHAKALSKSCFYHIRSFRQIHSSLDDATAASVASALVSSRLDQINSVLYGTAVKHTGRLQRVQRVLARVVVNQRSRTPFSSNELLKQLHWLPLEWRIQFKLATLTFKALHGGPPYLTDLLQHHQSTRSLRSSSSHQLFIPRHLDPVLSDSQPHGSGTNSFSAFAKPSHFLLLNTILRLTFSSLLTPPPSDPPSNAPWFFNRLRRYISSVLTYLLTYICAWAAALRSKIKSMRLPA